MGTKISSGGVPVIGGLRRDGNPERVPKPSRALAPLGKAQLRQRGRHGNPGRVPKPSRDASLPAKPAGSARDRPSLRETFANQRDVVKNERRQRVENVPLGAAHRLELEALFPPGHPYRHEVIGSMEDLDRATEADLKDFFNRYYAPNNAVLLIAGDIDPPVAKGLVEKKVVLKHALRNALTPVITLGALEFGTLLSGAVLTEQVFSIPGFGKLIVDAVFNRDYAVVQGVVLVTATVYILLNLLADVLYVLVNPRLRD